MNTMRIFTSPRAYSLAPVMAMACLLSAASSAHAVSVMDNDILDNNAHEVSSQFNDNFNSANLTDGSPRTHVFADGDQDPRISITDIVAPQGIDTLRLFDTPQFSERVSINVEVLYRADAILSLDANDYTSVGTFNLGAINSIDTGNAIEDTYPNPTFNPVDAPPGDQNGTRLQVISYAEVSGLGIPAGTQTILLRLDPSAFGTFQGAGTSEVQLYAIPEPTTMISLLIGTVSVMASRRRRA